MSTGHCNRCISVAAKTIAHTQLFSSKHGNHPSAKCVDFGGLRIFFCLVCHLVIMVTSALLTSESNCVNVFTVLWQKVSFWVMPCSGILVKVSWWLCIALCFDGLGSCLNLPSASNQTPILSLVCQEDAQIYTRFFE